MIGPADMVLRTKAAVAALARTAAMFGLAALLWIPSGAWALAYAQSFAAIWEKSPGPAWVARHGMTSASYKQALEKFVAEGYRLQLVSGYAVGGEDRYAAIWDKSPGPAWVARHGMTSAGYQQALEKLVAEGYRLQVVSGYAVGGEDRYAAIWVKSAGPAWVARHGLTSAGYQQELEKLVAEGYRLQLVSCYAVGGEDRYAAFWEKSPGPGWVARHGMTSAGYQQEGDRLVPEGYRPRLVSGCRVGGEDRYAAIWEQSTGPAWVAAPSHDRRRVPAGVQQSGVAELPAAPGRWILSCRMRC